MILECPLVPYQYYRVRTSHSSPTQATAGGSLRVFAAPPPGPGQRPLVMARHNALHVALKPREERMVMCSASQDEKHI
ncbi:hypothetical protein E2C01_023917 [Portunus trituberculatus]|uniref:Uncharacterized protein n=1 Tax=Portunus trituberculatus TaxID=210409 RepID=A0A5B7EBB9_PORTR|nr:hypothetical protein [Portunus trituberculatus]